MSVLYIPSGRAKEYAGLAVNHYTGCGGFCKYCFVPDVLRIDRGKFHVDIVPKFDLLNRLEKDCKNYKDEKDEKDLVLLSFACDPYTGIDSGYGLTRKVIEMLHKYNFNVAILTKMGGRSKRDFDLLTKQDWYGVTLTFTEDVDSRKWEPGAALPKDRIDTLKEAYDLGLNTWVSLEPVIDPEQTLELIRLTHGFVRVYKVGKLNYLPLAKTMDWKKFAKDVVELLESYRSIYYLKKDLRVIYERLLWNRYREY